jgi:hypothetical protein
MSDDDAEKLIRLFRDAGVQTSIDFWDKEEAKKQATQILVENFQTASRDYDERFAAYGAPIPPLNLPNLEQLGKDNSHKLKAFLQALDSASTPAMLVMVWRVLHGDLIKAIDMKCEYENEFHLLVILEDPQTGQISKYESHDIDDASLVRHFGTMKVSDKPLFDGFYALRTQN